MLEKAKRERERAARIAGGEGGEGGVALSPLGRERPEVGGLSASSVPWSSAWAPRGQPPPRGASCGDFAALSRAKGKGVPEVSEESAWTWRGCSGDSALEKLLVPE